MFWNIFFVSSKGGALCSAIVSGRLKIRKSLRIHYWQNLVSGVEVNNNVIKTNTIWIVSTCFVILCYFSFWHYFFQFIENRSLQKSGGLQPRLLLRFLWAWVRIRILSTEVGCLFWLWMNSEKSHGQQ